MSEFSEYSQRLRSSPSSALPFSEIDHMNMEELKRHQQLNPSFLESFNVVSDHLFSLHTLLPHTQPEFSESYGPNYNHLTTFCPDNLSTVTPPIVHTKNSNSNVFLMKKGKAIMEQSTSSSSSSSKNFNSPAASTSNTKNLINYKRSGKRKEKETVEVIHVRAKRGQATDSHSIAERVRREKINSKLRCLQDLVPGCNKSMGMAVMLEEIINYVHSLQNQVEFLSMELAAASCSYNFNLESSKEAQGTNSADEQEMTKKWWRQGYGDLNCFHTTTWSI